MLNLLIKISKIEIMVNNLMLHIVNSLKYIYILNKIYNIKRFIMIKDTENFIKIIIL
jgi:hypothetical protein